MSEGWGCFFLEGGSLPDCLWGCPGACLGVCLGVCLGACLLEFPQPAWGWGLGADIFGFVGSASKRGVKFSGWGADGGTGVGASGIWVLFSGPWFSIPTSACPGAESAISFPCLDLWAVTGICPLCQSFCSSCSSCSSGCHLLHHFSHRRYL